MSSGRVGGEKLSPWMVLARLLATIVDDDARADELLFAALGAAERQYPPVSAAEVLDFAAVHLAPIVTAEEGQARASELLSKLRESLAPPRTSGAAAASRPAEELRRHSDVRPRTVIHVPSPSPEALDDLKALLPPMRKKQPSISGAEGRPMVLLIQLAALRRGELGRALVREGFDVRAIDATSEVAAVLSNDAPMIALVDAEREDALATLRAVCDLRPGIFAVMSATTVEEATDAAESAGARLLHAHTRDTPLRDIIDRIKRYVLEPPDAAEQPTSDPRLVPPSPIPPTLPPPARNVDTTRVPVLQVEAVDLFWLGLAPDAAAVVEHVDGVADVRTLAERCGRSATEVTMILEDLAAQNVVRFND
jgi:hypothetical protein